MIDIVLPWVDGADPKWISERDKYQNNKKNDLIRFRDWGLLKYWFRSIETYAPWVNRVHFITCGQIPKWLNINEPHLNIVNHSDFIPRQFLPTFSSHVIELNMHRIKELSESFVYFNDDIFLTSMTSDKDFFIEGKPCDMAVLYPNLVNGNSSQFDHIMLNVSEYFDRHFDFKNVISKNLMGWYSFKYGKSLLKNILLSPFPEFPGLMLLHQPQSYHLSTLKEVWETDSFKILETCEHKFRTDSDVNQYIFRYWQIGKGDFAPYNILKRGVYSEISDGTDYEKLLWSSYKLIVLNDTKTDVDYLAEKDRLLKAFEKKYPNKSKYEL